MMLLDTNVLSELMRSAPARAVVAWFEAQPTNSVFISTITQAEILYGLELLPQGRRARALEAAAAGAFSDFGERILPFDSGAAVEYARVSAARCRAGLPITSADAQIAAIARFHGATLATRNVRDFEGCGIDVVDPW